MMKWGAGRAQFAMLLVGALAASNGCNLGPGACDHTFEDPVLEIVGATGPMGEPIAAVLLTDISVNGIARDPRSLVRPPSFGARLTADAIECVIRCGIGVIEGTYVMTVSTTAGLSKEVTVAAKFAHFDGGCPSSNAGSTVVVVQF